MKYAALKLSRQYTAELSRITSTFQENGRWFCVLPERRIFKGVTHSELEIIVQTCEIMLYISINYCASEILILKCTTN